MPERIVLPNLAPTSGRAVPSHPRPHSHSPAQVFNLQNPQQVFKKIVSPLKYQTRCVTAFPDKSGYLVGSIEGRVAVQHVDDAQSAKNFTFKCHREQSDIYAVNACIFHPTQGTFVTTGADGCYNFWDKDSKQRLKVLLGAARCSVIRRPFRPALRLAAAWCGCEREALAAGDLDSARPVSRSLRRWRAALRRSPAAPSARTGTSSRTLCRTTGAKGRRRTSRRRRRTASTCTQLACVRWPPVPTLSFLPFARVAGEPSALFAASVR